MEEKRNYQKGLLAGIAGGILGTLAVMAIVIIIGINLLVVNGGSIQFGEQSTPPAMLEDESPEDEQGQTVHPIFTKEFINKVETIYMDMQNYFLYDFTEQDLQDGMLQGMVAGLEDPYSVYYNEEDFASFMESSGGEYYGIGVQVSQDRTTGVITVAKVFRNSPGMEVGLLPDDILYKVNDVEVTGVDLEQVVSMIKSKEEGSTVKLSVIREDEVDVLDFEVERRKVEVTTVEYEMLADQVGYIEVSSFEAVTDEQFIEAYEDLKSQGMQSVVIDLRNNGGGLLDTVINMLDYLLPEGRLFYVKDKNGVEGMEYHSGASAALDIPLVVLVNGNSASASEVFAGNIQDFGVGKLVGVKTFGKGIMQQIYYTDKEQKTGIKLTVADYYIHSGRNIHKIGIDPDVEVKLNDELKKLVTIPKDQDNQLQKGIETLKEMIAQTE